MLSVDPQHGLAWNKSIWGDYEPDWTVEPDTAIIAQIARRELHIPADTTCDIKFLASGAFNKVYTIQCGADIKHVMRVSLPVQPHFKTMSEAATITYIRHHTDIPAPKVWASVLSNQNELGFEWMIQDYVPGRNLAEAWKDISWLKKEVVVRKIIGYLVQLFEKRFDRLGNLYATKDIEQLAEAEKPDAELLGPEYSSDTDNFCLSKIVSMPFFWGKHPSCTVTRGPFTNGRDWLAAQLELHLWDLDNDNDPDSDSDSDSDDFSITNSDEAVKRRASRLLALLPKIFPEDEVEQFVLHHNDLNAGNILVDLEDNLTGIIDWECVHTVPLYYACQMPKFLDAVMDRSKCPDPDKYGRNTLEDGSVRINERYYEHLEEYENQRLWEFFLEEMGRLCPGWVEVYEQGKLKAGFENCILHFGSPMCARDIDEWLNRVEKTGSCLSLQGLRRERQHKLNNL